MTPFFEPILQTSDFSKFSFNEVNCCECPSSLRSSLAELRSCKKYETSSAKEDNLNSKPKIEILLIFLLSRICMNKISITSINRKAEIGSPWRVPEDKGKKPQE